MHTVWPLWFLNCLTPVLTDLTLLLLPRSWCSEWQNEESCLLPFFLDNALEAVRNSRIFWVGAGTVSLLCECHFFWKNDLTAVEYIMGWVGVS